MSFQRKYKDKYLASECCLHGKAYEQKLDFAYQEADGYTCIYICNILYIARKDYNSKF